MIKDAIYLPVITTRDAEMKGFEELDESVRKQLFPLFELTRSRRSKTNPSGDVNRSLQRVVEVLEGQNFVVDVCGLESQSNSQISQLLDDSDGFANWCNFLKGVPKSAVPVAHLVEPFDQVGFETQIRRLHERFDCIALRIPTSYSEPDAAIEALKAITPPEKSFLAVIDAGYIKQSTKVGAVKKVTELLEKFEGSGVLFCAPISSSFPTSVVGSEYGQDETGHFPLTEVELHQEVAAALRQSRLNLVYGDYSLIHPGDFKGTVTNWVPRIDVPLEASLFYHRVRRHLGGYKECARRVVTDDRYKPIAGVWGYEQIRIASESEPSGRNPAFWISVRLNIHISTQVSRLEF